MNPTTPLSEMNAEKPGRCCVILGGSQIGAWVRDLDRKDCGFGRDTASCCRGTVRPWGRPYTRRSRARSPSSSPRYAPCRLTAMKPRAMIGTLSATRNQRRRIGPEAHHAEVRGHDDEAAPEQRPAFL